MKGKKSAGILLFRYRENPEVLLVHPGGPFWAKKDLESWSIPKGELDDDEDALTCARREFEEETGGALNGNFLPLEPRKLKSGKIIFAWALNGDMDVSTFRSNTFKMEWPPRSGKFQEFAEVDRAEWFTTPVAKTKINPGQVGFINELESLLQK